MELREPISALESGPARRAGGLSFVVLEMPDFRAEASRTALFMNS